MRRLISVFTFNRYRRLMILTLACKGLLISDRCHVRFANKKKRAVYENSDPRWGHEVHELTWKMSGYVSLEHMNGSNSHWRSRLVLEPSKFDCINSWMKLEKKKLFKPKASHKLWKKHIHCAMNILLPLCAYFMTDPENFCQRESNSDNFCVSWWRERGS